MICVTCKSDKNEACFKPSRKNVRGFSLHCTDCEHARRKKCRWCEKVSKYHGLCDMHVFRAKQLIQIGHSWNDFEQKEPWLIERQKRDSKRKICRWCNTLAESRGLCQKHARRAKTAIRNGASWDDFIHSEPMPFIPVKKPKAVLEKPPKESRRKIIDGKMICSDCGENKCVDEYYKSKTYITGLLGRCKTCHNKKCSARNTEKLRANPELRQKNRDYRKKWCAKNKDKVREYMKRVREANPEKYRELRRQANRISKKKPLMRLRDNLRRRLRDFMKGRVRFPGVGCTREELKMHIELQFKDGMTWENYGQWHIDHIRPCASFDLLDPEQARQCTHYTNLQPLWAADNIAKRDKIMNCETIDKSEKADSQ